jgi:hypothetical protein
LARAAAFSAGYFVVLSQWRLADMDDSPEDSSGGRTLIWFSSFYLERSERSLQTGMKLCDL